VSPQPVRTEIDRARAVRVALRRLVAARGFHGASMSAVAKEARVATGTAYVHYASKQELVVAAYVETKRALGRAATHSLDTDAPPRTRFLSIWLAAHAFITANADDGRFLIQLEHSPYYEEAHNAVLAQGDDPLLTAASAPDLAAHLAPLPDIVLWELGLAPAVRLAAAGAPLTKAQLHAAAEGCWRAISTAP